MKPIILLTEKYIALIIESNHIIAIMMTLSFYLEVQIDKEKILFNI